MLDTTKWDYLGLAIMETGVGGHWNLLECKWVRKQKTTAAEHKDKI